MIYLNDRYIYHNGIMVLPDYSNPRQFYYLPPPPRLVEDPETGRKAFKLLKLAGGLADPADEDGVLRAGVAFFDCDLRLTEAEQSDLTDAIRQQAGITDEINLAPVLYKDGQVVCYVLGEQNWDDEELENGTRSNLFVEQLTGFGKPSLYGDNRATFSARLTQAGASALEASFSAGGVIGLSIVYTLKFDALRPAFSFKVNARWDQIYHFLKESYSVDLFFFNYEDTSIVEKLEHEQLITFEEVIIEDEARGELKELRRQLQEYILNTFFKPVLAAGDPAFQRVPGLVHDVLRATVLLPSFGYQRVELTQAEIRTFSFEASRTSAIEQVIYPQAHLTALIPAAELPGYIQEVNTDQDLFFRQLDVECVLGGCDFNQQKIVWVHPYLRYGAEPEEGTDKVLQSMSERMAFRTWLQPEHGFRYRASYDVAFEPPDDNDPETIYGQHIEMSSPEEEKTDRVLPINPLELFTLQTTEFALIENFPMDRFPMVELQLRYEDSTGYKIGRTYILKEGQRSCKFRSRLPKGVTATTQYRLTYHRAQELPIYREWEVVSGNAVLVGNPFPSTFSVQVAVADRPDELSWADIVLKYDDPDHPDSYQEERFFFTKDDLTNAERMRKLWVVRTEDPDRQRYQYLFTIIYQDGTELSSPFWIESEARTLVVGRLAKMHRSVVAAPNGPTFSTAGLRDIAVTLAYPGFDEAEPQLKELIFEDETQTGLFTYQMRNPIQMSYEYEIRYRWLNGRVKRVKGTAASGALNLAIPTQVT